MDVVNMFMNLVAPTATLFGLMMFLPPFYLFKLFFSVIQSIFSENVAGKVVLITGASSGIGERALAYGSPEVLVIRADVSKIDDCRRFVEETINHFGQLNHLVNNAGITSLCVFEEVTNVDNLRPIMDIKFWGTLYPTYFAIPHLRKSRGKIAVIASSGGVFTRSKNECASKAALINFYECLRTEVGSDVDITRVTPGYVESEMTQGKHLSREGKMELDQNMRDVKIGPTPVSSVDACARGIVKGVCRGDRYITEPSWFKVLYFWKVFCPEVVEWFTHQMLMSGTSQGGTLSKKILDITGAKSFLYPKSIRSPQLKVN
ncbi:11beta-hydroxysteroid dehydrogenase [Ranunculus cassubicifolius]